MKNWHVLSLFFCSLFFYACDSPEDACVGVYCNQNGFCEDGSCVCEKGWTGPFCDQEDLPDTIYLERLVFTNVPHVRGSRTPLDPENGPDLYLVTENVYGQAGSEKITWPTEYPNADSTGTYVFEFPGGLAIPNLLWFTLYDKDGGPDDENEYDDRVPVCHSEVYPRGLLYDEGIKGEYVFDLVTTLVINNETGEIWRPRQATVTMHIDWGR